MKSVSPRTPLEHSLRHCPRSFDDSQKSNVAEFRRNLTRLSSNLHPILTHLAPTLLVLNAEGGFRSGNAWLVPSARKERGLRVDGNTGSGFSEIQQA